MVRSAEVFLLSITTIIAVTLISQCSASGYDSSGSCNPRPSRRGRAQLLATIPCDLTVQAYCNLPGTAYPWNAVRRFVHENQGLMRRMYGDSRHISVLKSEFEKNEIDVEDIKIAAARYASPGKRREDRKTKYSNSGHAGRLNDVLTEPHFRPATTTTTTSTELPEDRLDNVDRNAAGEDPTKTETKNNPFENQRTSTMSYTDEIENLKNKYDVLREGAEDDFKTTRDESVETNSLLENTTEGHVVEPISSYNQEKLPEVSSSTEKVDSKEKQQISSTLKIIKFESNTEKNATTKSGSSGNIEPIDNFRDMIIVDTEEGGGGGYRESASGSIPPTRNQIRLRPTTERGTTASTTTAKNGTDSKSPLDRVDEFSDESSEIYTDTKPSASNGNIVFGEEKNKGTIVQSVPQQQPPPSQTMMEGHLFQDSLHKNNVPVVSGRGVNACPVKEEVVAPFWANNTRGEVLALLNLYPYEQYVHWEKCTHENKQMYCREGCRCEQQYRLHRLLAYDPHNECRGIFSDWFRFPSCCICKCYDIPNEFRVTSRSPRSPREVQQSPPPPPPPSDTFSTVEEAERHLHEAVYSHATKDWYRVKRGVEDELSLDSWTDDFEMDPEDFEDPDEDAFN